MELLKNRLRGFKPKTNICKRFLTCPKCGYNSELSASPTQLPSGINASLLLDSSPTPQLLLSETNLIVYANASAARILRVMQVASASQQNPGQDTAAVGPGEGADEQQPDLPGMTRAKFKTEAEEGAEGGEQTQTNGKRVPDTMAMGLKGHTLDQLNIDIAEEGLRRWVSFLQVFENIKINLSKRGAKLAGDNKDAADLYGEGPKYNSYDYYGEQEKLKAGGDIEPDHTIRDTVPIVIIMEEVPNIEAMMYVTLIDPYSTGYSYSSITLVPSHAPRLTRAPDSSAPIGQPRPETGKVRKRDRLKAKLHSIGNKYEGADHQLDELIVTSGPYCTGKSGEDMLKRVSRLKDLILDEMEYSFIALSPDGDIVITNKATKAMLGAETLQASFGEGFEWIARLDIWRPDFSERLPFEEWALNKLITHRRPLKQVIGLYAGASPLVVELRGTCIWEDPEKQEGLIAALAIVVDQTQWFAKEKAMQATQFKQGMFLSNISRELRAPVAGIIGLLELLYGDGKNFDHEQHMYIQQILGSVNMLLLVVNDIIDFNKIESGDMAVTRNAFILQDLVEDIQTLFLGSMGSKGLEFEVDTSMIDKSAFGSGDRLLLLGDDVKMRRIAINLLSNAFKYTTEGKVTLTVLTGQVQRNSLEVRFEIKDTGSGFSREHQRKLFVPLEKMSTEDAKAFASGKRLGTDIGLDMAQKFATLIGGTIGCTSILGKGSTFWFTAPCGRPSPDSKPDLAPAVSNLSKEMGLVISSEELQKDPYRAYPITGDGGPKVYIVGAIVMLVEDNWAHQMAMQRILKRLGCGVITAVNGQNAVSMLKKPDVDVDLIIMDIRMPLLDGFEATKLIRTDPELQRWKRVPVIGLTATEVKGDREKAAEFGLDDYTVKPLSEAACKELLDKMLDPLFMAERRRSVAAKDTE